jgi:uncharacterized protein YaaN involved in tellurite resistance
MALEGLQMEILDEEQVEQVKKEVTQAITVKLEETSKLHQQAEVNASAIMSFDFDSLVEKNKLITTIEQFGMDTMQRSSQKNSMLKTSIGTLSKAGGESGDVARGLVDLNREIKDLDPSIIDFTKRGLFGKVRNYFGRFEKAESVIAGIVDSLEKGKKTLANNNTTLAIEQQSLRTMTIKLNKEIEMASALDEIISAKLEEAELSFMDADKINFVKEEILFPLRQRVLDMQAMLAVNYNGIVAMEIVQRNNRELMRSVDRAKTVTITALRTAVMVAKALYDQDIVLKKIQVLNETTNNMIAATSKMLREKGAEIHKQSVESNISVEVLKTAFQDTLGALADISTSKQNALPVLHSTISQFKELAEEGEAAILKIEKGNTHALR